MVAPGDDPIEWISCAEARNALLDLVQRDTHVHSRPRRKTPRCRATIELNAIASLLFRHIASGIGGAKDVGEGEHSIRDMDYANARADGERSGSLTKRKVGYALLQLIGDPNGLMHRAVSRAVRRIRAARRARESPSRTCCFNSAPPGAAADRRLHARRYRFTILN